MAFTFFFRDSHTIEKAISFLLPEVAGRQKSRFGMQDVQWVLNRIHLL
jgi:hypothetical protein